MILGLYLDSLVPPEIVKHRARVVAFNSIFSLVYGMVSFSFIQSSDAMAQRGPNKNNMTLWSQQTCFFVLPGFAWYIAHDDDLFSQCIAMREHHICIIACIFLFQ